MVTLEIVYFYCYYYCVMMTLMKDDVDETVIDQKDSLVRVKTKAAVEENNRMD